MAEVKGIASVAMAKVDPYSMQNPACIGTFGPSSTDFLPLSSVSSAVVLPPCYAARPPSSLPSPPSSPPSPVASFLLPPGPITFHPNVTI